LSNLDHVVTFPWLCRAAKASEQETTCRTSLVWLEIVQRLQAGLMGLSENVVYPFLPNGFADHYPG